MAHECRCPEARIPDPDETTVLNAKRSRASPRLFLIANGNNPKYGEKGLSRSRRNVFFFGCGGWGSAHLYISILQRPCGFGTADLPLCAVRIVSLNWRRSDKLVTPAETRISTGELLPDFYRAQQRWNPFSVNVVDKASARSIDPR